MKKKIDILLIIIGVSIIAVILASSFIYDDVKTEPVYFVYDDAGTASSPPFSPSIEYPLGSDRNGHSLLGQIINGAKYTIGLSLFIALARILISFMVALIHFKFSESLKRITRSMADAFHYAPLSLFAFILVSPVILSFEWSYDDRTKFIFPIVILIFLAVPVLTVYISNEMEQISHNDFIVSAKVLGGGYVHILLKHIRLFLSPKLLLLFMQQVGQTLLIFAHLGLLKIFIGGTEQKAISETVKGEPILEAYSMTYEWGGMIAKNFQYLTTYPWMVLAPVIAFSITILSIHLVIEGYKRRQTT